LSCFHADCDGHAASDGRRRVKFVLAASSRRGKIGKIGMSAAAPTVFKNALRFIEKAPVATTMPPSDAAKL
jgi:hypothetical protein